MTATVHLLLVSGSTRDGSTNTAALRTAAALAPDGVTAELYTGLRDLPAFVPGDHGPPATVTDLRTQVASADAVLFCTPEYAGTLPGSLKNLLDWLVASGELNDKPTAWLSVAATGRGGGALTTLETVLGYVDATLLRDACAQIPVPRDAVTPHGTVSDPAVRTRIAAALTDFRDAVMSSRNRPPPPENGWNLPGRRHSVQA